MPLADATNSTRGADLEREDLHARHAVASKRDREVAGKRVHTAQPGGPVVRQHRLPAVASRCVDRCPGELEVLGPVVVHDPERVAGVVQ